MEELKKIKKSSPITRQEYEMIQEGHLKLEDEVKEDTTIKPKQQQPIKEEVIIKEDIPKVEIKKESEMFISAYDNIDSFFYKVSNRFFEPIPTGFKSLDEKLEGGIANQTLVIVGGGTSIGKTAFTLNLISNIAKSRPIVYFTLEMSEEQIISKLYSHLIYKSEKITISNTDIMKAYDKTIVSDESLKSFIKTIKQQDLLKNIIIRRPYNSTINGIIKEIDDIILKQTLQDKEAPVIVIDYLQFIQGDKQQDSASIIKEIQRQLKAYIMKNNTIAILQTANSRPTNNQKKTDIYSGRDTSDIEYSADYLFQLNFYEYQHEKNCEETIEDLEKKRPKRRTLTIHKCKYGNRGEAVDFIFNGKTSTFEEIEAKSQPKIF
jgi:replicative DNA helicase